MKRGQRSALRNAVETWAVSTKHRDLLRGARENCALRFPLPGSSPRSHGPLPTRRSGRGGAHVGAGNRQANVHPAPGASCTRRARTNVHGDARLSPLKVKLFSPGVPGEAGRPERVSGLSRTACLPACRQQPWDSGGGRAWPQSPFSVGGRPFRTFMETANVAWCPKWLQAAAPVTTLSSGAGGLH